MTISRAKRLAILTRDDWTCHLCEQPITREADADIDHDIPKARGGGDDDTNLKASHRRCNRRKGSRTGHEYRTHLEAKPAALRKVKQATAELDTAEAERDEAIREANKTHGIPLRKLETVTGLGKSRIHVIANRKDTQ